LTLQDYFACTITIILSNSPIFLSCFLASFIHEFKVNKRVFKGIDQPVAYIGFPETSLQKWIPEGAEQHVEGEKHLVVRLPDVMVHDELFRTS